ncbi:MAG: nitroreductase family protein [Hungatella sp.]
MLKDLVARCRSYRRFYEAEKISMEDLMELVGLAGMTASTANSQALKFAIYRTEEDCVKIFPTIGWAGALTDWAGPEEGERPSAYILILCDLSLGKNKQIDAGITAQTILLGAVEKGYGGCMLGNIQRSRLAQSLGIDPEKYTMELLLALGKPKETVRMVPVQEDGSVRYYRDEAQVHYVPKRSLKELIYH